MSIFVKVYVLTSSIHVDTQGKAEEFAIANDYPHYLIKESHEVYGCTNHIKRVGFLRKKHAAKAADHVQCFIIHNEKCEVVEEILTFGDQL